ncbi:aspartyl protease family protein [Canna indica]|uniref:Aspartyl protease family protein n=1 Tax=Canna indica TaxID=4628 RepID=A0AAQ3JUN4_9LILI|nr:aspartyl protease family protein [Canna indica]
MASSSSSNSFLLCLLVTTLLVFSHVDRSEQKVRYHEVSLHSSFPSKACSTSSSKHSAISNVTTTLRVVHRDGPCSPLQRRPALSPEQILGKDQARVNSLHRRISGVSASASSSGLQPEAAGVTVRKGSPVATGEYIVTVGIGTPRRDQTLIVDTGSDITWIQCEPCVVHCHTQIDPIFNPARSSTYSNISCSSAFCSELDINGCDSGSGNCIYGVLYGDDSYTTGFYARDKLTLTPGDEIADFRFGCGQNNLGLFGQADGLLGLGGDKPSLVSQTREKYGGVFSYCLPSSPSGTGSLYLGGYPSSTKVEFTPMVIDPTMPTFYNLNLKAISVAGKPVPVAAAMFKKAGMIIDSGTVITRLPPKAYAALRDAFRLAMSRYRRAAEVSILDTCYNLTGYGSVTVPAVELEFDGNVKVALDASGVLYKASESQVCLAFAANDDDDDAGILGNVQQQKFDVVYDVSK